MMESTLFVSYCNDSPALQTFPDPLRREAGISSSSSSSFPRFPVPSSPVWARPLGRGASLGMWAPFEDENGPAAMSLCGRETDQPFVSSEEPPGLSSFGPAADAVYYVSASRSICGYCVAPALPSWLSRAITNVGTVEANATTEEALVTQLMLRAKAEPTAPSTESCQKPRKKGRMGPLTLFSEQQGASEALAIGGALLPSGTQKGQTEESESLHSKRVAVKAIGETRPSEVSKTANVEPVGELLFSGDSSEQPYRRRSRRLRKSRASMEDDDVSHELGGAYSGSSLVTRCPKVNSAGLSGKSAGGPGSALVTDNPLAARLTPSSVTVTSTLAAPSPVESPPVSRTFSRVQRRHGRRRRKSIETGAGGGQQRLGSEKQRASVPPAAPSLTLTKDIWIPASYFHTSAASAEPEALTGDNPGSFLNPTRERNSSSTTDSASPDATHAGHRSYCLPLMTDMTDSRTSPFTDLSVIASEQTQNTAKLFCRNTRSRRRSSIIPSIMETPSPCAISSERVFKDSEIKLSIPETPSPPVLFTQSTAIATSEQVKSVMSVDNVAAVGAVTRAEDCSPSESCTLTEKAEFEVNVVTSVPLNLDLEQTLNAACAKREEESKCVLMPSASAVPASPLVDEAPILSAARKLRRSARRRSQNEQVAMLVRNRRSTHFSTVPEKLPGGEAVVDGEPAIDTAASDGWGSRDTECKAVDRQGPVKKPLKGANDMFIPRRQNADGSYVWTRVFVRHPSSWTLSVDDDSAFSDVEDPETSEEDSSVSKSTAMGEIKDEKSLWEEPLLNSSSNRNKKGSTLSGSEMLETPVLRAGGSRQLRHWGYIEDTLDTVGFDEVLSLPSALARDVRFLQAYFCNQQAPQRHARYNETYAALREESFLRKEVYFFCPNVDIEALKRFSILEDVSGVEARNTAAGVHEGLLNKDLTPTRQRPGGSAHSYTTTAIPGLLASADSFRLWGQDIREGDMLRVLYLQSNATSQQMQEEEFQWFRLETLTDTLKKACSSWLLPPEGSDAQRMKPSFRPDLSTLQLAQYAPTLFWNLVFRCDCDSLLIELFLSEFTGDHHFYGPRLRARRRSQAPPLRTKERTFSGECRVFQDFHTRPMLDASLSEQKTVAVPPKEADSRRSCPREQAHTGRRSRSSSLLSTSSSTSSGFCGLPSQQPLAGVPKSKKSSDAASRRASAPPPNSCTTTDWSSFSSPLSTPSSPTTPIRPIQAGLPGFSQASLERVSSPSSRLKSLTNSVLTSPEFERRRRRVFSAVRSAACRRVALWGSKQRVTPQVWTDPDECYRLSQELAISSPSSFSSRRITLKHLLRRERRMVLSDDPQALIESLLDSDGFPRQCLSPVSLSQRRFIYGICCLNKWTAPLDVRLNEKGRAVYAAKDIGKDDFICEYAGEFVGLRAIARLREAQYEARGLGSYMFYFHNPYSGVLSCIDATEEKVEYGPARFINHSHLRPNCFAMAIRQPTEKANGVRPNEPRLVFIAKRFINANEELLIDYGETDPMVLKANPWLINS